VDGCARGGSVPFFRYLRDELHYARYFEPLVITATEQGHWALVREAFDQTTMCIILRPLAMRPLPLRLSEFRLLRYLGIVTEAEAIGYVAAPPYQAGPIWGPMVAFIADPRQGARNKAALLCAIIIQLCDAYLQPKRYLRWVGASADPRHGNRWLRLLLLAERLPQELQMVLCLRAFGMPSDIITWDLLRTAMRHLDMMLRGCSDSVTYRPDSPR